MNWHSNFRKLRIKENKTQEDVSFNSNICHSTINRLESGKVKFNEHHLMKLSACFNIPVSKFVFFLNNGKMNDDSGTITRKNV